MKLYFAANACSLSPHIVLRELGLPFELVRVNNKTKQTSDGRSFLDVNPKGYVAALVLDNGEVLTEGPAILQYLADLKPEKMLAPANGTWERVRLQETLNFITSEIHAGCAPLFSSETSSKRSSISASTISTPRFRAKTTCTTSSAWPTPICTRCCRGCRYSR
jgi:glutathione S-transferase